MSKYLTSRKIEQAFIEVRPFVHAAAVNVVRKVVDVCQSVALGRQRLFGADAGQSFEVDVVEADVADVAGLRCILAAPPVDEVDQAIADALDGRNVQFARAGLVRKAPGAQADRALVGRLGILHAKRNRAHAGPVLAREALREGIRFGVDDEVDRSLAIQQHVLVAVLGHCLESHALEDLSHGHWIRRGIFDELEAVGLHWVVPGREGGGVAATSKRSPEVR